MTDKATETTQLVPNVEEKLKEELDDLRRRLEQKDEEAKQLREMLQRKEEEWEEEKKSSPRFF